MYSMDVYDPIQLNYDFTSTLVKHYFNVRGNVTGHFGWIESLTLIMAKMASMRVILSYWPYIWPV